MGVSSGREGSLGCLVHLERKEPEDAVGEETERGSIAGTGKACWTGLPATWQALE